MAPLSARDRWLIRLAHWSNRARFFRLRRSLEGRVEFGPACEIWAGSFIFRGAGRAFFGRGCAVERGIFPLLLEVEESGRVFLGEECWVRGKYRPNILTCFEHAEIRIGSRAILNGVIISARESVSIGRRALLAWDVTILDSNLHPLCNSEPLKVRPVTIGDHVWIGAGSIILPGAEIGSHSVIGARSVVLGKLPDHVLAAGAPARVLRRLADRDEC